MTDVSVDVYVNHGWWVGDCPREFCGHAEFHGKARNGAVGLLTLRGFECGACGLQCAANWPAHVDDLWRLLQQRPDPRTRNWRPPETLQELLAENLEHGIAPIASIDGAEHTQVMLQIVGDEIVRGRELLGPPRLKIGA